MKFTVEVWEEGCGSFIFTGVEAKNKNEACDQGIDNFYLFCDEEERGTFNLNAVAKLEAA